LKFKFAVSLEVSVTNNANLDYYSLTHYQASESGVLDLDKAAPVTGAYRQVDPMSIFWTMKPKDNSDQRFWSVNVEEGLHCKFQVYDGMKVEVQNFTFKTNNLQLVPCKK